MKGYIYITANGTDPAAKNNLNDPIFGSIPTLGACMPNIRRVVEMGDYIFLVTGKTPGVQQFVAGGMRVLEKIDALAAYKRFPENRLQRDPEGQIQGNIIVTANGKQHPLDDHESETFENRIKNYIVGTGSIALTKPKEVATGRAQTLEKLSTILQRPKRNRVIDVMGRWAKLDESQIHQMLEWLQGIKASA